MHFSIKHKKSKDLFNEEYNDKNVIRASYRHGIFDV